MFPISCKVTFSVLFFVLFKAEKTVSKLHHMGKMFNIRFGKTRFGFWRGIFFKSFIFIFTTCNLWEWPALLVQWTITTCALTWDRIYRLSTCVEISRSNRVPVIGNETGRLVNLEISAENESTKVKPGIYWEEILLWCENFNPVKHLGFCINSMRKYRRGLRR